MPSVDVMSRPRIAAAVVTALARAGLQLCSDGYMAINWCYPLARYRAMFLT